jgi:hypothetical protein
VGWDELSNFQSVLTYLVLEGKQVEHAEGLYVSRDARWQGSPKYFVVHRAIGRVNRNVQHPRVIVRAGPSSTKAANTYFAASRDTGRITGHLEHTEEHAAQKDGNLRIVATIRTETARARLDTGSPWLARAPRIQEFLRSICLALADPGLT